MTTRTDWRYAKPFGTQIVGSAYASPTTTPPQNPSSNGAWLRLSSSANARQDVISDFAVCPAALSVSATTASQPNAVIRTIINNRNIAPSIRSPPDPPPQRAARKENARLVRRGFVQARLIRAAGRALEIGVQH